jgi:cyclopropane fatty-acyl-phospholipid synthase-like methyltransferase
MRALILSLVVAAACQRTDAQADKVVREAAADKTVVPPDPSAQAAEQARFDSERQPQKIVEALELKPGDRVADIGAGSGLLTVHLAKAVAPNGRVVATDIDGAVLDLLAQRLKDAGLGEVVERRVVGAETPDLEAGTYDAILLSEVDHYFSDPAAWLREAATALKPGGRIVISNRIYHRAQSMAAARRAGLVLKSESNPDATRFIAVFVTEVKK